MPSSVKCHAVPVVCMVVFYRVCLWLVLESKAGYWELRSGKLLVVIVRTQCASFAWASLEFFHIDVAKSGGNVVECSIFFGVCELVFDLKREERVEEIKTTFVSSRVFFGRGHSGCIRKMF